MTAGHHLLRQWRSRSLRCAVLGVVLGCTTGPDTPDLPAPYAVGVMPCQPGDCSLWQGGDPLTVVQRGDTVWLVGAGHDNTQAAFPITIRGICARQFEVRRSGVLVATFPTPITCPDSVIQRGFYGFGTGMRWVVPDSLAPGPHTLTSYILVQPSVTPTIHFAVQ